MEIDRYVDEVRRQVQVSAQAGGDEAVALADRLTAPVESALRLAILEALSAAAEEITLEMAPGSVELRLRGREPEFVVSLPEVASEDEGEPEGSLPPGWRPKGSGDEAADAAVSRINLRLPEELKSRVEQAAEGEGLSVNSWLVRAVSLAVGRRNSNARYERGIPQGAQRYTGWAR
jgi:hypothetical protein